MKVRFIIYSILITFYLLCFFGCSAKPIDRAKIAIEDLETYDLFYAHDNINYDLDDDFDIAFGFFCAVYDPEKNIVGFTLDATIYPKFEKTIKEYCMFIMIDENLHALIQTIQTSFFIPHFTDSEIQLDDSYLYITYEPYGSPTGTTWGSTFYSIPLEGISKEDVISRVKEGIYFRMVKNKKLGPLKKLTYNGEVFSYEDALDPNGSQEPLFKARRPYRQSLFDKIYDDNKDF